MPERNAISHTHARASSELAWERHPRSVNSRLKTSTVPIRDVEELMRDRASNRFGKECGGDEAGYTSTFSVSKFFMTTMVRAVDSREECLLSHACSLEANMRGIQWHPRVQNHVRKRAPHLPPRSTPCVAGADSFVQSIAPPHPVHGSHRHWQEEHLQCLDAIFNVNRQEE